MGRTERCNWFGYRSSRCPFTFRPLLGSLVSRNLYSIDFMIGFILDIISGIWWFCVVMSTDVAIFV